MRIPFRRQTRALSEEAETRSMSTWFGGLSGLNIIDPSAIPPPGLGINRNWAGVNINERTALQMDAVFTSLRIITNGVMELGDPYAFTEALDDSNWPYRKRLAVQPAFLSNTFGMAPTGNIEQPQYIGTEQTVFSMGLWGEAWWYGVEFDRLSAITAVEVLNPAILELKNDQQGNTEYLYGVGTQRVVLDPSKLIHIPHKTMPGAQRGLSSLDYAGVNMAIALAAVEYGARWFSQGMSPGYVLTAKGKLGQDEVQRIVESLMIQHGGLAQAHLPLLIDSDIEPKKMQATPDEAKHLQTLEYCRSVVASYFGIPASLLGNALQRLTPQPAHSIGEEMQRMVIWTLSGYIDPLEQIYSALIPGQIKVAFDRTQILQTDAQSFAMLLLNMRQTNAVSINEIRTRYLGLAPVEGGDEVIAPLASNTAPEQTGDSGDEQTPLSDQLQPSD
jgi:HK97 family phage portal protein